MKKRFIVPTFIASLALITGGLSFAAVKNNSSVEETFDATDPNANWGGLRATPFGDRYTTNWSSEPKYSTQNPLQFNTMNVGDTWKNYQGFESGDKPITVAVIDSGIDIYHEDFLSADAKNVTITESNVESYSILDPKSCYIYDTSGGYYSSSVKTEVGIKKAYDTDTYDEQYDEYYSHGTASAACIGAAINGVGGLGIAPKCNLLIIRMDFYFTSLDKAIRYAADNGADVINMSLGAYAESFTDGYGDQQSGSASTATALTSAINYALGKDCVVVAAAGNEKTNHKSYPACNAGVIGVGALASKSTSSAADFSNFNSDTDTSSTNNNVDVMAPGYVYTANMDASNGPKSSGNLKDTSYQNTQGTSFASPLTAGAVALARSKYPDKTHTEIENLLISTCSDIGTTGWDKKYGYGRVNITTLLGTTFDVEELTLSESSIQLYNNGVTKSIVGDVIPSNATNTLIHWTSSNTNVATVPATSNAGAEVTITPKGVGTTTITATSDFDPSISSTCTVTVSPYVSSEFTLSVGKSTLMEGETTQAIVNFKNTNPTYSDVLYESSNEKVATISDSGLITAVSAGTTTITAMSSDDMQEITITVTGDPTKQTATIVHSDWQTGGSSASPVVLTATKGVLSASVTKGYNTGSQIREYAGGSITISVSGGVINAFTIHCDDSNNGGTCTVTSGGGTAKSFNNSGTYGISYAAGATPSSSVTFTNGSQARFSSIDVTYKLNETPVVTNYTVSFNSNGGTGSMTNTTTNGSSYTVPACTFTRTNYTFSKWALGSTSGTQYSVGDTITAISSDITLYALWTENQSTGGGDSGEETSKIYTFTDKSWKPWTSVKDGAGFLNSGVQITQSASGANANSKDSFSNVKKAIVTYCTNSSKGAGTVTVKIGNQTLGSFSPSTTGGTTARTSEITSATALSGIANISVTCTTNSIYICGIEIFEGTSGGDPVTQNYTVSFNANGGSGSMTSATTNGSSYVTPSCGFTKSGYTFDKWALNSATGTKYAAGATITGISAHITLYATWTENSTPTPDYGNYYKDVNTSSLSNIQSTLHSTISAKTVDVGYDGLFNAYKTTDVKPGTNYFWDMYSNENYTTTDSRINANYSDEGDSINREHTIPQSWFNESSPMKADLFHVYPTDGYVNNRRSNYPHADVSSATYTSKNGSKLGTTNNSALKSIYGNDAKFFEVIDEYKGDFARSYFYFATRYSDKISSFTADGKKMFQTSAPFMASAFIDIYYQWHLDDPVSEKEINRNNAVYSIQNNRNPYIDHPEWVAIAFGKSSATTKTLSSITLSGSYQTTFTVGDTFSYTGLVVTANYSDGTHATVTPTSVSSPNMSSAGTKTVTVSYTEGGVTETATYEITVSAATVAVTGVSLNPTSLELSVGEDATLTATVAPSNATNKNVTWESSNNAVARVNNGTITAVSAGNATITVKTVDGNKTATCAVTVKSSGSTGGGDSKELSFVFTSNPGSWPTTNSTTLTNYTYTLDGVGYSFGLKNAKINAASGTNPGYLMLTNPGVLGLPAIDGYKLTKVVAKNTSGCSTSVYVGVSSSSSSESYITGGAKAIWGTTNSTYTYNLSETSTNTVYYLYATSKNAQISSLDLTYEKTGGVTPTPKVNSVTLNESSLSFDLNGTKSGSLTATVDADVGADYTLEWSSTNTSVATISGNTNTVTINAVGVGTSTITASAGGEEATCIINVTDSSPIVVNGVSLNKPTLTLTVGSSETLIPTISPTNATNKNVTWSSSNTSAASVDNNGKVSAIAVGSTTITVTTQDGGYTAHCTVTVTAAPVITYQLEADETSVPYMSGTNHSVSVGVKLYQYTNGVKGSQVASGTGNVDTSILGPQNVSFTYQSVTYYAEVKVTNVGAENNVGKTIEGQTVSETKTYTMTSSSFTGGFQNTTMTKTGNNGFESTGSLRGTQWSKTAGSVTISGFANATITSVSVVCSNNGQAGTQMSVKVGNTSFGDSIGIEKANNQTLTFNSGTGISGNSLVINTEKGSASIWIKSISVTILTKGESITFPATPGEQASAWADYFVRLTRTENACLAADDATKLAGLKEVWSELKTEYEAMVAGSKDSFCSDSENAEILKHYQYIISKFGKSSKYGNDGLEDFVKDSKGNKPVVNSNAGLLSISNKLEPATIVTATVAVAGVVAIGLYFGIKKRKEI